VKQECIRETWLLIKEIENLEMDKKSLEERIQSLHKKNKALVKNHQDEVEKLVKVLISS